MIALFFDTETTGFRSPEFTPEIVQIAAIMQDTETQQVLAELNLIVEVTQPIPERVSAIHGITDEIAGKYGVGKDNAASIFGELIMIADVLVAHNIAFDLDIIDGAWPIANFAVKDKQQFCTMRELIPILKLPKNGNAFHNGQDANYKAPKLIEAYQHFFGHDFDNAHNAMADVRACRDIYFAMHQSNAQA